jgi:hypothetical protein
VKKRGLTLIAGILMSILVVAQETMVSGSIRDKKSGETLIGVNITIKDKLAGTISD